MDSLPPEILNVIFNYIDYSDFSLVNANSKMRNTFFEVKVKEVSLKFNTPINDLIEYIQFEWYSI